MASLLLIIIHTYSHIWTMTVFTELCLRADEVIRTQTSANSTAVTVCSTQTEVTDSKYNTLHMNFSLHCIEMRDAKLIRQAYYCTVSERLKPCSAIHQSAVVRGGGGICSILYTLTWLATVAKSKREASQFILLALPSGLQTNPLPWQAHKETDGGADLMSQPRSSLGSKPGRDRKAHPTVM